MWRKYTRVDEEPDAQAFVPTEAHSVPDLSWTISDTGDAVRQRVGWRQLFDDASSLVGVLGCPTSVSLYGDLVVTAVFDAQHLGKTALMFQELAWPLEEGLGPTQQTSVESVRAFALLWSFRFNVRWCDLPSRATVKTTFLRDEDGNFVMQLQ